MVMRHVDMRKLPAAAQEERRRQVIGLRQRGLTYEAIAGQVGLSRTGVIDICQRFAAEGAKGLVSKPRGRKPDEQRLLDAAQEAEVRGLICRHTPDELGLPVALWSRAAVGLLITRRCGVELAVRTVGKYLARWGFTPSAAIPSASLMKPSAAPPRSRSGGPTSRPSAAIPRASRAEPSAASPGGGAALAAAGVSGHRGAGPAGTGRDLLGRRDRAALR
jgi:transposase